MPQTHSLSSLLPAFLLVFATACGGAEPVVEEPSPEAATESSDAPPESDEALSLGSGAELTMIAEDKDLELATLSLGVAATEETPAPPPEEPAAVAEAAVDPGLGRPGGRTIGAEAIKAVIDRNSGQVKACYERQLKSQPSLSGKVVVAWTIGADGRVRTPWVPTNSTGNRTLAGCVQRAVGAWRFPTAESPQDIEYPFVFKPRGF